MTSHATGPQAFVDAVQDVAFGPVSVFQKLIVRDTEKLAGKVLELA